MTAELKSLSASLTAPKLPDNLFTVTDIDAELSKVRDDESDFIAADFSRLICAETDFSATSNPGNPAGITMPSGKPYEGMGWK